MVPIAYNKLRLNTDSPFLRGEFPNPLKGGHLNWMTVVSDAMQGSCGGGKLKDTQGNDLGTFKASGGMVMCTLHIPLPEGSAEYTCTLRMPSNPYNRAPVFLSDGQVLWGTKVDNLWTVEVTVKSSTDGYCSYWS